MVVNLIDTLNSLDSFKLDIEEQEELKGLLKELRNINFRINDIAYKSNNTFGQHTTARIHKEIQQLIKDFRLKNFV